MARAGPNSPEGLTGSDAVTPKDPLRAEARVSEDAPASNEQFAKLIRAISRSQANYRELIDNLDQAVFTLSVDGEVRVANLRLAEILGATFQELIGHSLSEFIESPTLAEAVKHLPELLERGSWSGVVPLRLARRGELRHFSFWLHAVVENGQFESITGWARDITAQQDSEMRLAQLFDTLREGIFFTTPDGRFLDANPAFIKMMGYESLEDLQSCNARDIYADSQQRDELVEATTEKGIVIDKEIKYRKKNGEFIYCLASAFAIPDPSGKGRRFQGRLVDITERREIERKLLQEQEFVRTLVTCFPDLIVVQDRNGKPRFMSDRVKDILGLSATEYFNRPYDQRIHPEDQGKLNAKLKSVIAGEAGADLEIRAMHADGSWRTLRVSAGPLFDENGAVTGVVSSARDVTQVKQLEKQLALNEKFAAMGQMMGGVAHELNNPLTAILGVSDLLRERSTDDTSRHQVDLILQQARRAAGIVQNLLAFTRPAVQGMAPLCLDDVVREALSLEKSTLSKKNIEARFEAPKEELFAQGDRRLLLQVFRNIIVNAEQAISSAGDHGVLKIAIDKAGEFIRISFTDDGPGIPAENLGKIFDPFFTTKRPSGGSGLGLAICLAVAKEHGGTIEVESPIGSGATFRLVVPAYINVPSAPPVAVSAPGFNSVFSRAVAKAAESAVRVSPLQDHTILIVDDEESIREIVEDSLAARGMKVSMAGNCQEALHYLESNPCEIVLCDYNMPGMTGGELFEKLLAKHGPSGPRFVLMTGDMFSPAMADRYRELGAAMVQKPFRVSALASLLQELLQLQPSPVAL